MSRTIIAILAATGITALFVGIRKLIDSISIEPKTIIYGDKTINVSMLINVPFDIMLRNLKLRILNKKTGEVLSDSKEINLRIKKGKGSYLIPFEKINNEVLYTLFSLAMNEKTDVSLYVEFVLLGVKINRKTKISE